MTSRDKKLKRWNFIKRSYYRLMAYVVPRSTRILFDFRVNGIENVEKFPEGSPVIFCSNHQSHLDAIALASAIVQPFGPKKFVAFMANGKAMKENIIFRSTKYLGAFPVFKDNPRPALEFACKILKEGMSLFISPQGKRIGRSPFHDYFALEKEGRTGVARIVLSMNCEVPVIPFYIHGTAEALGYGQLMPRFGSYVSLSFGKAMFFDEYKREDGWDENDPEFYNVARKMTDRIMFAIREQLITHEETFFNILQTKFSKKRVEDIVVPKNKEKNFRRMLSKLTRLSPEELQKLYSSYF